MSINKQENTGLKHLNDIRVLIKYSNNMDHIYKNIKEDNANKKHKILIVFDDMISNMLSNKKLNPIATELFIIARKTKHFSCFKYTILFFCTKEY